MALNFSVAKPTFTRGVNLTAFRFGYLTGEFKCSLQ